MEIKRYWLWLLSGALGYAAYRTYKWSQPRRVVALGTSLTVPSWSYIRRLRELLPAGSYAKNYGHGGKGVWIIRKTMNTALATKPSVVILETLVNDVASKRNAKHMRAYNNEMLRKAKAVGAKTVFLVLVPLKKSWWKGGRDTMTAWAKSNPLIDEVVIPTELFNADGTYKKAYDSGDRVHMNSTGHRKLGEILRSYV